MKNAFYLVHVLYIVFTLYVVQKSLSLCIINVHKRWRETLEARGFRLSRSKTEYLQCRFSAGEDGIASEVAVEDAVIPRVERFRYLGSIIQENGEIDEDINHRIKVRWQK